MIADLDHPEESPVASPSRDFLGESDTESLSDGASTISVDGVVVESCSSRDSCQAIRDAFMGLDAVDCPLFS